MSKNQEVHIIPETWSELVGEYQMAERLSGCNAGNFTGRNFSIAMKDDVLVMHPFGPINPIDDNYIVIASGPFAGETIEYSVETGKIIHQNAVFIPIDDDQF